MIGVATLPSGRWWAIDGRARPLSFVQDPVPKVEGTARDWDDPDADLLGDVLQLQDDITS